MKPEAVWMNQREIGQQLGVTAQAVGKLLKAAGLMLAAGIPTKQAISSGYCRPVLPKPGVKSYVTFYLWNYELVAALWRREQHATTND